MIHCKRPVLAAITLALTLAACKSETTSQDEGAETTTQTSALSGEAPETKEPADDSGKPTVAVANAEDNSGVPVYLASIEKERITVSFHDVKDKERIALSKWLSEQIAKDPSSADDLIPTNHKLIPARYRKIKGYEILLPENSRASAKVKGFHYFQGASADHLVAVLDLPKEADNQAYGIARPEGTLSDEAKLEPAKDHTLSDDRKENFVKQMRSSISEKMLERDRKRLPIDMRADQFTITKAALPAPHEYVVAIDVRLGRDVADERISGLALLDKDYKVTTFVEPPNINLSHYKATLFLDLKDKSGVQMIYESTYYEGHFMHLLQFVDGKPQIIILEGDGA